MKRLASLLLTSLMLLTLQAQISPEALRTWHSNNSPCSSTSDFIPKLVAYGMANQ